MKVIDGLVNLKIWGVMMLLQVPAINDITKFVSKYIFSDYGFLKWLVIASFLDLITGVGKAIAKKEAVTSKGLRNTILKVIQYGSFLIITHVLTHFEIDGHVAQTSFLWLNKVAYEFIILIEIKSVYENIVIINPKLDFFKKVFKKIADTISDEKEKK